MKAKSVIKRLTIYTSLLAFLFLLNSSSVMKKNKDYFRNRIKVSKNKIEYSLGTIYIGSEKYLEKIDNLNEFDILALDERNAKDPNIKVYNSFMITNADTREEIIESLLYYEEMYPSEWNRTKNSLLREWYAHNIMHDLGYKLNRTTDVDLNNADEMTYRIRKH